MVFWKKKCFQKEWWIFFKFIRTYPNIGLLSDTLTWNTLYIGWRFSGFAFYTLYYIHLISSIVEMWICRNSLSKDEFWRKESTAVNSLTYVNFEFSHHFFYALNLINLPLFAYFVSITYILLNNKQIENSIVFAH